MSNEREKEDARTSSAPEDIDRASRASAELLDLVRSAEEQATLATREQPSSAAFEVPSSAELVAAEEFVDVGDDAVDEPPSLSALRLPATGTARGLEATPVPRPSAIFPPAVSLVLLLAVACGALALLTR